VREVLATPSFKYDGDRKRKDLCVYLKICTYMYIEIYAYVYMYICMDIYYASYTYIHIYSVPLPLPLHLTRDQKEHNTFYVHTKIHIEKICPHPVPPTTQTYTDIHRQKIVFTHTIPSLAWTI